MRNILILGAGAGGTIVANMLRTKLSESEWQIVIVDRDEREFFKVSSTLILEAKKYIQAFPRERRNPLPLRI